MAGETVVTRGNQITLTKEIREKMKVSEGDSVILNLDGDVLLVTKKNPGAFDNCKGFLPKNFDKILKELRSDEIKRLRRLGILE